MTTDNRTQKKKRPFIWVVSRWVVWCFSLSIGTLQQGCPCGWLLGFVGRFCPRLCLWRSGLQYNINCFGRLLLSCFCSCNGLRVSLCCPPVVWFLLWLFCGYFEDVPISAGRFRPSAGFLRPKLAGSVCPCSLALFIGFLGFFSEILKVCAVVVLV